MDFSFTFEDWANVPDVDVTLAHELPQPDLQEEERRGGHKHVEKVGDQEGATWGEREREREKTDQVCD